MSATPPTSPQFQQLVAELQNMGAAAMVSPSDDQRYRQFIQLFPAASLGQLTLSEYCVGKGDGESFCWWLEFGLQPVLGRYMPGNSRGHILYFLPDGTVYKNRALLSLSDEDALRYTLAIQVAVASTRADEDWRWVDDDGELYRRAGVVPRVTIGDGRKLRLLSVYHPDIALPINSSYHLGHFLAQLGYPAADMPAKQRPVARMMLLRQYMLLAREVVPGLTTVGFMHGLYSPNLGLAPVKEDSEDAAGSPNELTITLTDGAIQNGYVRIPKQQVLFPAESVAANEKAAANAKLFALDLPDGTQIPTCLLANRGRIKARFTSLFKRLQLVEGDKLTLSRLDDGHYEMLLDRQDDDDSASGIEPVAQPDRDENMNKLPLNQILFGPPGTGKTYETIRAALQILDPVSVDEYDEASDAATSHQEQLAAREALKARFDQLRAENYIRVVTFHQSFSYEDFVEGLRAKTVEGQVQYQVEAGIFKQICQDAAATPESVSLEGLLDQFIEQVAEAPVTLATTTGKQFRVSYRIGNTTLTCEPLASETDNRLPANIDHIRSVLANKPVENLYCASYVKGIADHLRKQLPEAAGNTSEVPAGLPYVLIIDEINRGNISRIFGELITLIEPSKRAGAAEVLSVTLPYSKEPFSVPANVYLIGTMNTSDRSLAGLDIALRRRFTFREMAPRPELLDGVVVKGVNIGQMLRVMNQRITVLLDRDHSLGHAYFMPLQEDPSLVRLADIFRQNIIPLLQEYFFEDWERIRWVLNDQNKAVDAAFIVEDRALNLSTLFAGVQDRLRQAPQWMLNDEAFDHIAAYRSIVVADVAQPVADEVEG